MKRILLKLKKKSGNERGQGMVEYILIFALVIAVAVLFGGKIKDFIGQKTDAVGGDLMKTNF